MIEKRFTLKEYVTNHYGILDNGEEIAYADHKSAFTICELLNEFYKENELLHLRNNRLEEKIQRERRVSAKQHLKWSKEAENKIKELSKENEQLKQDNASLMKLLENQSIIIQKLHSKILEFELKEPIVLTKEDLELMDKAISYYTHGRYGE